MTPLLFRLTIYLGDEHMSKVRTLTLEEIGFVSGAGPIADAASAVGAAAGQALGKASGAEIGASVGAIVCSPGAGETAGVSSAVCAAISYTIGSKYGEVTGAAGGTAVGAAVGRAIESYIDNPGESIDDAIHAIFSDYSPADGNTNFGWSDTQVSENGYTFFDDGYSSDNSGDLGDYSTMGGLDMVALYNQYTPDTVSENG